MFVVGKATTALINALSNLQDKEDDLNELDQGSDIESALGDLETSFAVSPQPIYTSFYR